MSTSEGARIDTVPAEWSELTPAWLTAALARDFPGAEVDEVAVTDSDSGTNRRGRLAISYGRGTGPATAFVKAEGPHREVHRRNGNLFNEPELFSARLPLPLPHPRPYHVVIDRPGLDYFILMEDVTSVGGDPRDSTQPVTVDQAAAGVRGLARLHRQYQGVEPEGALSWLQTWEPTEGWLAGLRPRIPVGLERGGSALPPEIQGLDGDAVLDLWTRFVSSLTSGGMTLLHGDAHIGNTYVLPGDDMGFLDWQVARRGNWSQDVGYFLMGAVVEDDRRRCEREIVAEYAADTGADPDEAWLRYRASAVYGLAIWLSTLGTTGYQRSEVSLALAVRYAWAAVELESAAALDELGV